MIEVEHLSKRYGSKLAVDDLSFTAPPGTVTGFLGPNGAGKSTTMRMIAGLDRPTSGSVRVNGQTYAASQAPMAELGTLLEAKAVHTGRSARNHLLAVAQTAGIKRRRVEEVVELVGLTDVANWLSYGASPRASLGIVAASRALARAPSQSASAVTTDTASPAVTTFPAVAGAFTARS